MLHTLRIWAQICELKVESGLYNLEGIGPLVSGVVSESFSLVMCEFQGGQRP